MYSIQLSRRVVALRFSRRRHPIVPSPNGAMLRTCTARGKGPALGYVARRILVAMLSTLGMLGLPRAVSLGIRAASFEGHCVPQDGARPAVESPRSHTAAPWPRHQDVDATSMGRPNLSNLRRKHLRTLFLAGGSPTPHREGEIRTQLDMHVHATLTKC